MNGHIIAGVFSALCVVLTMKYVPIFHGFDSNDVKRILFEEDGKKYTLVPSRIEC